MAVAAVLAAAGCAEASDANPAPDRVETAPETTPPAAVDASASTTSTEPVSSTTPTPTSVSSAPVTTSAPDVLVELDPADWAGLERWRLPALGGVTFGVPEGSVVHHDGDMITIRDQWQLDRGRSLPTMILALITDSVGSGIEPTVEAITTTAIERYGTARPDGTQLEMFGLELTGWEFALDDTDAVTDQRQPLYLLPAMPRGARGETFWEPFPISKLYLADTAAGVFAIGFIAANEAELTAAETIFDRVAPTVELEGIRSDVPVTGTVHPAPRGFPGGVDIPAGWPPVLSGSSQRLDAGEYSTGKLGSPLRFTVGDGWWVQPNLLGMVVLSGDDSSGPGDRAVAMRLQLDHIVAVSESFEPIGDPLEITGPDGWPRGVLPTLTIDDEQRVEIGNRTARRFDVSIDPEADCSDDQPCQYDLLAPVGPTQTLRKGYRYRIWEITDQTEPPITLIAQSADPSWLDRADELVDSIRFANP